MIYAQSKPVGQSAKSLFWYVLIVYYFCYPLRYFLPSEAAGFIDLGDEVVVLVVAAAGLMRINNLKWLPTPAIGILLFVGFSILSTFVSTISDFPIYSAMFVGIALDLKLWIVFLSAALILRNPTETDVRNFSRILIVISYTLLVAFLFAVRDILDGSYNIHGERLSTRAGLGIPTSFFTHKGQLAQFGVIALASALTLLHLPSREKNRLLARATAVLASCLVIMTLSVKETLSIAMVWLFYLLVVNAATKRRLVLLLPLGGLIMGIGAIAFTDNPIRTSFADRVSIYAGDQAEDTVRTRLVSSAIDIAITRFPFGTGPGTFASQPSRSMGYSPIYIEYGFNYIHGGRVGAETEYLMDGFWPKILGEAGAIGFIGYLGAVLLVLLRLIRVNRANAATPIDRFSLLLWVGALPISLGTAPFTNERFLLLGLAGAAFLRIKQTAHRGSTKSTSPMLHFGQRS